MSLKNKAITALLATLTGTMLPLAAQAQAVILSDTDYTDVWWNPQRSGWGMNLVQQQDVAYVSLHGYKADGTPTWYVAPLTRGSYNSFTGNVYRHASAPVSAPLTVNQVSGTPVGNFVFAAISPTQAKITYTIDGQQDEQIVTRFTFTAKPFEVENEWDYTVVLSRTTCSILPSNAWLHWQIRGASPAKFSTHPVFGGTTMFLDLGAGCNITGILSTEGRFGQLTNATLQCSPGWDSLYKGPRGPIPIEVTLASSPGRFQIWWSTSWISPSVFYKDSPPFSSAPGGSCIAEGKLTSTDDPD